MLPVEITGGAGCNLRAHAFLTPDSVALALLENDLSPTAYAEVVGPLIHRTGSQSLDMLETLESIVSEAESTWWRAEAARSVTSKAQAGARIQDIADRYVPVYTVDLLKLAQRDVDLATTEPTLEGVLQRQMTATALIARNVFDVVTDHLWRLYYAGVSTGGRRDAA